MELRSLETFVAVAEERSFTRAADRLHVVQSAVSAGIRKLEHEFAATLFDRSTAHVELSDAGQALLPEARGVLAAATAAREAVELASQGLRGTIALGTMQAQAMGAFSIAALVAGFQSDHPAVKVEVRHGGGSLAMVDQLRAGRLDLTFLSLTGSAPAGIQLTLLGREPIVLTCSAQHRLARRRSVILSMLAEETFVEFPAGWGVRMANDRAFAAAGIRRTITSELNDSAGIIEFVRHGLGVSLLPASTVAATELTAVPIRYRAPIFDTYIATSTERRRSAATLALLEAVRTRADLAPPA
jgi:DNA-binding transcriptional LysR family regulator